MRAVAGGSFWVIVVVALAFSPRAEAIAYAGGSLIVPTQASYQNAFGTVSTYGLIYNVLRANEWLAALAAPGINGVGQTPTSLLCWFFRESGREY
jgi:hypothetical protein